MCTEHTDAAWKIMSDDDNWYTVVFMTCHYRVDQNSSHFSTNCAIWLPKSLFFVTVPAQWYNIYTIIIFSLQEKFSGGQNVHVSLVQ